MPTLKDLADLGQAVWLDYIRRSFITSGELQDLIDQGVRGVTANPTILEKAIVGSNDYDDSLRELVEHGKSPREIYEALVFDDIGRAADLFRPVYDSTGGGDGFVSLEVSPDLAYDTAGTIEAAQHLFWALGRPNVFIKVPATAEGIPAIESLISQGVNINITLMFSMQQYIAVAEAYLAGLEKLAASGGNIARVASVASFFVSRVDTLADDELEKRGIKALQGKIAIANAKLVYAKFEEVFSSQRWATLAQRGARVQRPLWASTSTKNPLFPDTMYVDELIGPDTVNTMPPATLKAWLDHGRAERTVDAGLDQARADLARLAELGIDLDAITRQLTDDGVKAFDKSFETLMASIVEKRERQLSGWQPYHANLGRHQSVVDAAISQMAEDKIPARMWALDYTIWKPQPTEISNRLGWLHSAEIMFEQAAKLQSFADEVRGQGYTQALLLGMGGSSLAPGVFRSTFGGKQGYLDLAVLDSTVPGAVLSHAARLDPSRTLFIVSTKSGTTVETLSFFKYFYNRVVAAVGADRAGERFVAITDPESPLMTIAERHHFRRTFLNDPNIGGRYSALSLFGVVPAALLGMDLNLLLDRALDAACSCEPCVLAQHNPGIWLGAILGELAKAGRDKVTFLASAPIASFGDWVEQLLAESTGKDGRGIVPVVGEPPGDPAVYGSDRLFVHLHLGDDTAYDQPREALEAAGQPVVLLRLQDAYDLGRQFFLWEMATAVAGYRLGINPFDQPDVERAKALARDMVGAYMKSGSLPTAASALSGEGITVYGDVRAATPGAALADFLGRGKPGDYVALQAYVEPTPETDAALLALRVRLRDELGLATTVGYGPRFLHSTGQLHKGDGGRGLFIQITADDPADAPIPDEAGSPASAITFGVLKTAQALGDRQALLDAGRRVISFHLGADAAGALRRLTENTPSLARLRA